MSHPPRLTSALADRYRIEREIGEGGMATVYLAEDLKHDRKVAIKVLRPELAAVLGAERFVQEIKTTANLQHPNILPLFDSGEAGGFLYYVMPYIEGETLRDRLNREKQLGIDEAVKLTTEVAEALDYAHRHEVIHRDIKPENILLHDGRPMVADFGIALAVSAAAGGRMTETGLSLGTPHYMSPEQATGEKEITPRSDVYSLGAVLYEMLSGEPPHTGATVQQIIAKILADEPRSVTQLRKTVPPNVAGAASKALEKLPADRFDSAGDFVEALRTPSFRHGVEGGSGLGASGDAVRWKRVAAAALIMAGVLAGMQLWGFLSGKDPDGRVRRQRVVLGSGVEHIPQIVHSRLALAPDGSGILFADTVGAGGGVQYTYWWKAADQTDPVRIPNMDDARVVVFSPDGQWVAYVTNDQLRKQPLLGGTTVLLAGSVSGPGAQALAWLDDGTLLFENGGPILERISEDGTARDTIATVDAIGFPIHLSALEGGGALLSSCTDGSCSGDRLFLVDLERDTIQPLADDVLRAWSAPGGRIVYVDRRGGVFAAGLDRAALRLDPPVPLFDGVATTDRTAEMEIGADGSLIYLRGQASASQHTVVWVDREGRPEPVHPGWGADDFVTLALSPEDDRLAVSIITAGVAHVWVKELPDGPLTRLTVGSARAERPVWAPDGRHVAYIAADSVGHTHARIVRSDGSSPAPQVLMARDQVLWEIQFADDRSRVLFRAGAAGSGADVGYADLPDDTATTWILNSRFAERGISLSPGGRWLAYVSDVSGRDEVYVRPFPEVGARRVQISANGGTEPLWAHSGRDLFYRDGEGWMTAASVSTEPEFRVDARERLFDARGYRSAINYRAYDVARDDQRFIMLQQGEVQQVGGTEMILVENWFAELRRVVASR